MKTIFSLCLLIAGARAYAAEKVICLLNARAPEITAYARTARDTNAYSPRLPLQKWILSPDEKSYTYFKDDKKSDSPNDARDGYEEKYPGSDLLEIAKKTRAKVYPYQSANIMPSTSEVSQIVKSDDVIKVNGGSGFRILTVIRNNKVLQAFVTTVNDSSTWYPCDEGAI